MKAAFLRILFLIAEWKMRFEEGWGAAIDQLEELAKKKDNVSD